MEWKVLSRHGEAQCESPSIDGMAVALVQGVERFYWQGGFKMIARLRCFFRNQHNPVRHPLGGFRCLECGQVGADLEEMGYVDGGYVMPVRRVFSRTRGEFTRTMSWEPSGRGW
jgi:hypothetical protein